MSPSAQDPVQVLLAKACYHAQVAVEALGGPFMAGFYPNMAPSAQDPIQVLAAKLAYWTSQLTSGSAPIGALWTYWEPGPTPSGPPPNTAVASTVRFTSGDPPVVWNPATQEWL